MTPITDKINQLPDGYVFEATPWTRIDSPVNDGFLSGKHVEFNTDDLKALVSELARKTRALGEINHELGTGLILSVTTQTMRHVKKAYDIASTALQSE